MLTTHKTRREQRSGRKGNTEEELNLSTLSELVKERGVLKSKGAKVISSNKFYK